jgi:hypothetical protein
MASKPSQEAKGREMRRRITAVLLGTATLAVAAAFAAPVASADGPTLWCVHPKAGDLFPLPSPGNDAEGKSNFVKELNLCFDLGGHPGLATKA